MFRIGSAKLVCRLQLEATTPSACRLFECEGSCFAKRSLQENSSYTDEDPMATETCSSKTLASCESGNGIKSCRRVDKKHLGDRKLSNSAQRLVRQNFMRRRWTRNPRKSRSSRKSSLQLKRWRSSRMMQRSRTSRRMQHCDGCILWIEISKIVESGEWTSCGTRSDH